MQFAVHCWYRLPNWVKYTFVILRQRQLTEILQLSDFLFKILTKLPFLSCMVLSVEALRGTVAGYFSCSGHS